MAGEERLGAPRLVSLSDALAPPLQGALLSDGFVGVLAPDEAPREVLARADDGPVWIELKPSRQMVGAAPAELALGEPLRARLAPGRCIALLALVHFVRQVLGSRDADTGEITAAFVFDDPNLHWPTYGHVHYGNLAAHAREHGYHAVIAMVPLDGWLAHPAVIRTFVEHPAELSICVHGNDHLGPELGRIADEPAGVALASRAIRRSEAFAARTGLPVDPVMVPPHEELSEVAARGLASAGYEAVCVSRPYPWIPDSDTFAAPPDRLPLSGWRSREILEGGLPVLLRAGFNAPLEDLVLRAYLGQPLILYGHHDLLAGGPEPLARAAAAINALGPVRWGSLATIARAGLRTRRRGELLEVEMLARRALLNVPAGVRELRIDHGELGPTSAVPALTSPARVAPGSRSGVSCAQVHGGGSVELEVAPPWSQFPGPQTRTPLPAMFRRLATEARDRLSVIGRRSRDSWT